jgi:hypothetical protein
MDDRFKPRPVARWYMIGAVASLLFMLLVCAAYAKHLMTDPATLPLDERALYLAEPSWVAGAFGLTGIAGAVGGLLLVMRRKTAQPLLFLALLAVAAWFAGLMLVPQLRDLLMTGEIVMALIVCAITWTIFWFARHSRQRGWLR